MAMVHPKDFVAETVPLMVVPVEVGSCKYDALIATGANVNAVSHNTISSIMKENPRLVANFEILQEPIPVKLSGFSKSVSAVGKALIYLEIGGYQHDTVFFVFNDLSHDFLLGTPWFHEHKPTIDWENHQLLWNARGRTYHVKAVSKPIHQ
ncbi:hypothetical protein BGZ83_000536 [Gryganskiella cystojenkinii]|nr:hypothetical protein BGZ83_000536 [Gryganskiella cystojenkinii]